ncbi:bifunctional 5-dehydro-2-deoxygluconokinase/5-dehydro-2-deoxyphosphogluconate aldolase [Vibrio sp. ER1A]|uniref:bifunctional 5-dehydro-2-deoxygluconokinase/5-dehydro-2- deoxyphosphogluconate aldolase n=1 Tax=Vibrio sp. ER1A TaxID=1517681 RepID=UPI0004DD6840|nr:5-dehydro-2-deoxygluconokinase [Vibrio sp. ER1A]KFA97107.1 5-dehydro-2-deoxygluconokinase [Vibrio sp. ER1A]
MRQKDKKFDVICMGRVAVDFYGQQIGSRLEDMSSFSKYLGGSSGNVAYGTARQGLKSSMLARVGDEHMGRFLREELERLGVDTSFLITDKERLTALVILGIKDEDTFPLIFYRDNCADMAITSDDVDEDYIASARCLAITGTHLSNPKTRDAVLTALRYARKHGVRTALDIDYRPVLWGLTSLGDGETRFIESGAVTEQLQEVLGLFDLIVGTEEEFHIAGGSTETLQALNGVRKVTDATLVCKRGALGCSVYDSQIPNHLDGAINATGVRVDVLNVLGAGDAFMSGLLRGYLNEESWQRACDYANACGALVVSRHGCAPAMPSKEELDDYLARAEQVPRPDLDTRLNHLHRVTTRDKQWDDLCILAFDHRIQLEQMAQDVGASLSQLPKLKKLILEAYSETVSEQGLQGGAGLLCDSTYGQAALNEATGKGWWIGRPIELPGSRPLELEHGNIGSQLVSWPKEHIVKCLVFYHPDDAHELKKQQERLLSDVYLACCQSGHELLIEVILPSSMPQGDNYYIETIQRLYQLGIKPDWWKLPPLLPEGWRAVEDLVSSNDSHCYGVVLLGLDASKEALAEGFKHAQASKLVKGFAVGRTIFGEPSKAWLANQLDDDTFKANIKANYLTLVSAWKNRM